MTTRVKTARGRPIGSTKWLQRQLNDPYVAEAKKQGYRSRAAFKLKELHEKYKLFKKGDKVIDLGAAPGGWCQVAVKIAGPGLVLGVDLLEMEPVDGVLLMQGDFLDPAIQKELASRLPLPVQAVISDMAPNTTGHRETDHLRIMALLEESYAFAREVLAEGGLFLAKIFQGGAEGKLLADLKRDFKTVRHVKPAASRKDSVEMYLLATGYKHGS